MAKVISVANQKGGVGKTTTTINLASSIGRLGRTVLIIDIDPQGNATSGLGVDRQGDIQGVYECMLGDSDVREAIRALPWERISLLAAGRNLMGAEVELMGAEGREHFLTNCIGKCKDLFDYILIDCPPSLGLLTINSLAASDSILMPIQCEYYALEGLGQLLHIYNLVKQRLNPGLEIEGIVLTMADTRTRLSGQVQEEVRKHFGERVFNTVIPRNVKLGEAPGFGKPVIEHDPRSRGAAAYLALAHEFLERNGVTVAGPGAAVDSEVVKEEGPQDDDIETISESL